MADGSLTQHLYVDDSDEGFEQGDFSPMGMHFDIAPDDISLPPLRRVQKYSCSSSIVNRQMVPSIIIELLRTASPESLEKDLPEAMKEFTRVGEESVLRADLLDRIPRIAKQLLICSDKVSNARSVIGDHLIPFLVRNLGSTDTVIDRTAQASLVRLVEHGFISKFQVEIQVCPSILALSKAEMTADINAHTGAITLMSKLAQYLGRDVVERVFLKRFTELCSSSIFYVRRLCAANIGEFSNVVGREAFENQLLPCYLALCADQVWSVRKACAEVVMYVSCCCTSKCRKEILSPVFVKLLQDDCRWVKRAAYQSLGFFISTFANPTETNIGYSSSGDLVLTNNEGEEFEMNCSTRTLTVTEKLESSGSINVESKDQSFAELVMLEYNEMDSAQRTEDKWTTPDWVTEILKDESLDELYETKTFECDVSSKNDENVENGNMDAINNIVNEYTSNREKEKPIVSNSVRDVNDNEKVNNVGDTFEDDLHLFNSHIYWYISPDLPLDPSIIAGQDHSVNEEPFNIDESCIENVDVVRTDNIASSDDTNSLLTLNDTNSIIEKDEVEESEEHIEEVTKTEPPQDVIPQALVDHFISMTDAAVSLHIDSELTYHCAYSLPAVALTLGKDNWHLLKNTVDLLASDMQYKVRKTVASGLHEIAIILGPEIATESLLPLFDGFLKDLDEVRIGVLKHLAQFLKLIEPSKRKSYLPKLSGFLRTDSEWNWRFRYELASQLLYCIPLFEPADTAKQMGVIAIGLLCDKVAAVREMSLSLVKEILRYISREQGLTPTLLMKLVEHFAHSKKWKRRQTFCMLCSELLFDNALPCEQFASELMPHLLDLSWDPVANVRLVVANCLSKDIITNSYFSNPNNEHYEGLETVLRRLQADKDRDVRQSAEVEP